MPQGVLNAHRWIGPPTGLGRSARNKKAGHQQHGKHRHQPERRRVQLGERHVGRADHGGNQQIVQAVEDREQKQEQHHCSMHRVEAVVNGGIHQIRLWCDQLASDNHRQQSSHQEEQQRSGDVLNANHLGIGVDAEKALPVIGRPRNGVGRLEDAGIEVGAGHGAQASWGMEASPGSLTIGGGAGGTVAQPRSPVAKRLA